MEVIWTPEAETSHIKNLNYLESEWNDQVIQKYLQQLDQFIRIIAQSPETFPLFDSKRKIRRCVVTSQISLYFKVQSQRVFLLALWNNSQNPGDLKF